MHYPLFSQSSIFSIIDPEWAACRKRRRQSCGARQLAGWLGVYWHLLDLRRRANPVISQTGQVPQELTFTA
jgi:hypothetical protein